MKENIESKLLDEAYNLSSIGIQEYAWNIEKVLIVIEYLKDNGFLILGGDVYEVCGNIIKATGDSWYINKDDYKSMNEYIKASFDLTKDYIKKYNDLNGKKFIYSLVFNKVY